MDHVETGNATAGRQQRVTELVKTNIQLVRLGGANNGVYGATTELQNKLKTPNRSKMAGRKSTKLVNIMGVASL